MKLVHKETGKPAKVDDFVFDKDGDTWILKYFVEPHKPSSEGKVTVLHEEDKFIMEYYASVVGLEWIEREDRELPPLKRRPHIKQVQKMKDDMIALQIVCPFCTREYGIDVPYTGWIAWCYGKSIQFAMPNETADTREALLSGICSGCWDKVTGGE